METNHKINKVIFIIELPFTAQIFDIFDIETLILHKFDVEIWDLSLYLHSNLFKKTDVDEPPVFNKCKKFDDKKDIIQALSETTSDAIVNCFIPLNIHTFFIFHLLSVRNIKYCVLQFISFPNQCIIQQKGQLNRFLSNLMNAMDILKEKHGVSNLCNAILYNKILLKYYLLPKIRPADIAILYGEKSLELNYDLVVKEKTHLMWVNAYDYDTYLKMRPIQKTPDPTLGVFLDDYLPLHPDFYHNGKQPPIEVEEYYKNLCLFFNHLERNYNVRIIIAAHPHSKYDELRISFGNRTIIKGRTVELVQESSFVLTHMSTSLNFAVLFRKPIVFITMNTLQKRIPGRHFVGSYIETIAHSLNKNPINIDNVAELDWENELHVDMESYARYQNDYIKRVGTPDISYGEIFAQTIKKLFP